MSRPALNEQQARIIRAAYFRADASVAEIGELCGCRPHVVRETLRRLEQRGIIRQHLYYNGYALGAAEYQAFMNCLTAGAAARKRLVAALQRMRNVSWLAEVGGDYDYDLLVQAESPTAVADFFDELSVTPGVPFFRKTLAVQLSLTYFPPKFLGGLLSKDTKPFITSRTPLEQPDVDALDRQIVAVMASGAPLPLTGIARSLGIAVTTLHYRISKLQKRGIIHAFGYILSPTALGYSRFLLLLQMKRSLPKTREHILQLCSKHPSTTFLIENLGAWDYQIGVAVRDARDTPRIQTFFEDALAGELGQISTVPVYSALKLRNRTQDIIV